MNKTALINRILLSLSICLALSGAAQAQYQTLDKVAVIVDDEVIMQSDIDNRVQEIQAQMRQAGGRMPPMEVLVEQVRERLILESIQVQLATRGGIRVSDADTNEALSTIAKQNGLSLEQFIAKLDKEGLDYQNVRSAVRNEIIINQLRQRQISSRVHVSDQDLDLFLSSEEGKEQLSSSYRLAHIYIGFDNANDKDAVEASEKKLAQALAALKNGEPFSAVAVRYSQSPAALEGGDLGWKKAAQLPSLFAKIAGTLDVGETSEAIKAGNGFHILKLIDRKGGEQRFIKQYDVRHILIKPTAIIDRDGARAKLENIRQQISNSELSFEEAAKKYSDDPGSGSAGGDLGWVTAGQMVEEFDAIMLNAQENIISPVFSTQFGWHILQVRSTRQQDMSEEFKVLQAKNALHKRKFEEELDLWLQKIRQEAYVDIK